VLQDFTANAVPNIGKRVAETWLSNCRKLSREGRYNCDARAHWHVLCENHGVQVARPLQTSCRNTRRARQSHFSTMAYTLQKSGEPVAKALCRRSGLPLRRARASAALTTKCDLKTRIRTHVNHGSATSGFLRQRCCRTMTFKLQNYCKRVAEFLSGWVAVGYDTLV
jgi:hypothetical protein